MKAAQINEYGGKDVLRTVADAPKPTIGKGQVLVAVRAAGVNPFDWKVREGLTRSMAELHFPATLGGDFAGVIAEVGEGVTAVKVGDEIYGQTSPLSGQGAYAEFTPVKTGTLALKPKSADFEAAAALPLTGVSAYQALVEHAGLQSGQKVLIHGGAGGIGTIAVQLAKHIGAHVAATAASEDSDYVRQLGADEVIDYTSQDFTTVVHDYDVVYDLVGGEVAAKSYGVLKQGGILVSMVEQPDEALMQQHGVRMTAQFTQVTTERLTRLAGLVDSGAIKVHIDRIFPLEQAADALAYIQAGSHRGKVVIRVL